MKWSGFWLGAAGAGLVAMYGCGTESAEESQGAGGQAGAQAQASGPVTVFGRVSSEKLGAKAAPVAGAEVTLRADLNGDGTRTESELVKVTTDAQGRYVTTLELKGKGEILASFTAADKLARHERVVVTPPGSVRIDTAMYDGEALEIEGDGSQLRLPSGKLAIKRLAPGLGGAARIFNPAYESEAFPGDFVDDKGTPIVSGVFATVELEDDQGNPVHDLGSPATLEMEVPRETWRVIRDMTPGTDRIDVPRYWFDESKGQWVQEGMGHLVDAKGEIIGEDQLLAITGGGFQDKVIVVYEVTHFTSHNLDFPQNKGSNSVKGKAKGEKGLLDRFKNKVKCFTHIGQCDQEEAPPPQGPGNKRKIGDFNWSPKKANSPQPGMRPQGEGDGLELVPLTGAYVQAEFYYADGAPAGNATVPVEADGAFDVPVGRSEPDGEDLDGNGIPGEKMFVYMTVEWEGLRFHLAEGEVPSFAEQEADLGDLEILQGFLRPTPCEVKGTVKYLDGTPAAGAELSFESGTWLTDTEWVNVCGESGDKCVEQTESAADGSFRLMYAFDDAYSVAASHWEQNGPTVGGYSGSWRSMGMCPAEPISVVLDWGEATTTLQMTAAEGTISWSPERGIASLWVLDAQGELKWDMRAGATPMSSPVEYGEVPAGASESEPAVGSLEPGDTVYVDGYATTDKGYPEFVEGELEIQ